MRMKELNVGVDGNLYLDIMELPETCVIVLSKGVAKVAELPAHVDLIRLKLV